MRLKRNNLLIVGRDRCPCPVLALIESRSTFVEHIKRLLCLASFILCLSSDAFQGCVVLSCHPTDAIHEVVYLCVGDVCIEAANVMSPRGFFDQSPARFQLMVVSIFFGFKATEFALSHAKVVATLVPFLSQVLVLLAVFLVLCLIQIHSFFVLVLHGLKFLVR